MIENGLKKLLNFHEIRHSIGSNKNDWFIALKKNDGDIYNFKN